MLWAGITITGLVVTILAGMKWKSYTELKSTVLPRFEPTREDFTKFEAMLGEAEFGLSPEVHAAKDILATELYRRFTDLEAIEFGMSRVSQPGSRIHTGPTMSLLSRRGYGKTRTLSDGGSMVQFNGSWYKDTELRPLMLPENSMEQLAVDKLHESGADVAIYTVGRFEYDNGEAPSRMAIRGPVANPHYDNFRWIKKGGLRASGPAYLRMDAHLAPKAFEIVDFAREAWASRGNTQSGDGKGGWKLFASKIAAPDMSCAKCHKDSVSTSRSLARIIKGPVQKPGDSVGLLIIALRNTK